MTKAENDDAPKAGGRPRSRATDEAILKAALELFIETGADGASIEKIAKRAGTTRAAVYRRYAGKEDLLVQAIGEVREAAEGEFGGWEHLQLPELVALMTSRKVIRLILREDYFRLAAQLIGTIPNSPEIMAAYRKAYLEPRSEALKRMLADARDRGQISRDADVGMIVDLFVGAFVARLVLQPPPSEKEMLDFVRRLVRQLGLTGA